MMNFVLLTLSFTVATLLASGIMFVVMFRLLNNTKVMKWYTKWVMNYMKSCEQLAEELEEEMEEA